MSVAGLEPRTPSYAVGQSRAWEIRGTDSLGIRLLAVLCCTMLTGMARPRGRTKPARLTVNLDRPTYRSVVELARREDVSVSWVVRRAIERVARPRSSRPLSDPLPEPPSG